MPEMTEGMRIVFRVKQWGRLPCDMDTYTLGRVWQVVDGIVAVRTEPDGDYVIRPISELDWHEWPEKKA